MNGPIIKFSLNDHIGDKIGRLFSGDIRIGDNDVFDDLPLVAYFSL